MRLVLISDTHGKHRDLELPEGDVLLHAGDFTSFGRAAHFADFDAWLGELPFARKIVVLGNHENPINNALRAVVGQAQAEEPAAPSLANGELLAEEGADLGEGVRVFGCGFKSEWDRDRRKWDAVPADTTILVTHNPPKDVRGGALGCDVLRRKLAQVRPALHVFGHVHFEYGAQRVGDTLCVNAASVDEERRLAHAPVVVDLDPATGRAEVVAPAELPWGATAAPEGGPAAFVRTKLRFTRPRGGAGGSSSSSGEAEAGGAGAEAEAEAGGDGEAGAEAGGNE